jgi:riboflavin kinase / FMN adenylyltransferase
MQDIRSLEDLKIDASWVTIGSFDGVHLGHQAIIHQLVEKSHSAGAQAVVVTFYPHPALVLRGIQSPYYLTTLDERIGLLGELGIDKVVTLPFDRNLAALTAEEFMQKLHDHLGIKQLWVGEDFALGRNRQGTVPVLREIGSRMGYEVETINPITVDRQIVSSSLIRNLISQGKIAEANRFLGRKYSINGEVVHGDGRGHGLGIPTANLDLKPDLLVPVNGVYATWTWLDGIRYPSVTSIGLRPTFKDTPPIPRAEPYLLDFHRNIYGKILKLDFVQFIRSEERFASIDLLLAQIQKDILKTREILSHDQ